MEDIIMSHYTKTIYCKNCGQACTVKIYLDYKETSISFYNSLGKINTTHQVPIDQQIVDPSNEEIGYFCDYCGQWNDYDDY